MKAHPSFTLNNGVEMPALGLGTYNARDELEIQNAIHSAFEMGYRLIDTASFYENEGAIGKAIQTYEIERKDVFLTTKVWNTDQGYDNTLRAFDKSCKLLGVDYLDLYLVHWPVPDMFLETYTALEKLYADGRIRAIGVSNFGITQLQSVLNSCSVVPAVNQIEFNPFFARNELLQFCTSKNIRCQAWSPIARGKVREFTVLRELALKYNKTEAQVTLRWMNQKGLVPLPKTTSSARLMENAAVFDFDLTTNELSAIDGLSQHQSLYEYSFPSE